MKITTAIQQYVDFYLIAERQYTSATITGYLQKLKSFLRFVGDTEVEEINQQSINMYRLYLHKKQLTPSSMMQYLVVVRELFKYTRLQGTLCLDSKNIKLPRNAKSLPHKALSIDDFKKIIQATYDLQISGYEPFRVFRDRAILYLLYGCGMRHAEILYAHLEQVTGDTIIIIGKGNKIRRLHLISVVRNSLDERLAIRGADDCPFLFVNRKRKSLRGQLSHSGVTRIIKKYSKKAELSGVHPHQFRHGFATNLRRSGVDLRTIQKLMGHTSLLTTMRYLEIGEDEMKNAQMMMEI